MIEAINALVPNEISTSFDRPLGKVRSVAKVKACAVAPVNPKKIFQDACLADVLPARTNSHLPSSSCPRKSRVIVASPQIDTMSAINVGTRYTMYPTGESRFLT